MPLQVDQLRWMAGAHGKVLEQQLRDGAARDGVAT
jgi:hypothetical protein